MKLIAEIRDPKTSLESVRAEGKLPAVCYGKSDESTALSLDAREFLAVYKQVGSSAIIELDQAGDSKDILVKEVQYHPVSGEILHVDLYTFTKGEEMEITVPLEFVGESAAEKAGAVVTKVAREILVRSLPRNIPGEITIDLSAVAAVGDSIHIKDIVFPEGVTPVGDLEESLVTSHEAQEIVEEETPTEIDMDAIESEQKGKKEEDGEGGESESSEE